MKTIKLKRALVTLVMVVTASVYFTGCDIGGDIVIPSGATDLSVSVKSDDNVFDNPADIVVITEAKALITEIEYERERDGVDQLHQTGPFVINFMLDGSLKELLSGYIVRDIYTKAKFKVHKAEDNQQVSDPEFNEGHGDNQRYSFIIKGTYNGAPFVYKSKKSMNIVIGMNKSTNINLKNENLTVVFNKVNWFMNNGTVLNPNLSQNADIIDNNIKDSFKTAFKDDNKDGRPDDN
jgi:hypothetical protein